jgi:O-antigen ligase
MWLSLSKLFLALLILYTGYFQAVFFQIPNMLLILGFIAILFLLIAMYQRSTPINNGFTAEIILWIGFALSSLFIGYITVMSKSHLISSIFTLIENIILIIAICYISKYDGNIDYVVKVFIILTLVSAITAIFWGEGYHGGNRISLSANTNPNGFGVSLVIGMACLLYKLNINKKLNIALVSAGVLIFLYTIILTGSRKSFLAAVLLLIYWFLFCFGGTLRKTGFGKKIGAVVLILISVTFFMCFIAPIFDNLSTI